MLAAHPPPGLLVLFRLPDSGPRLEQLTGAAPTLAQHGVQMLAMPEDPPGPASPASPPNPLSVLVANPEATATYELFRTTPSTVQSPARPLEFLIDRQGYLRARWQPRETPGWNDLSVLLRAVDALNRERPAPAASDDEHAH